MASTLYILVDYDNVPRLEQQKGVDYVLHCALDAAAECLGKDLPKRATVRLYGGWYDGLRMTRKAQALVGSRYFSAPCPRRPTGPGSASDVLLYAELARALLSLSGGQTSSGFTHTLRTQPISRSGFRARFPSHLSCATSPCFVADLDSFLRRGVCPKCDLKPNISECMLSDEQKLVDVMLATDLLHLAYSGSEDAVLVTSDDDFWPAIVQAACQMRTLVHVHTQNTGQQAQYEPLVNAGHYVKTTLT